jgi:hypothetical protein
MLMDDISAVCSDAIMLEQHFTSRKVTGSISDEANGFFN